MGKTYRHTGDEDSRRKNAKNHNHSSGKKTSGMRIINDIYDDGDDDFFKDDVKIEDVIVINKNGDNTIS
jgi:hypothetical protein